MAAWAGSPVSKTGMPRGLVEQYQNYSFEPVDRRAGAAFASFDDFQAKYRIETEIVGDMINRLKRSGRNDIARAEAEFLEKGKVWWRHVGYGSLLEKTELRVHNKEQVEVLGPRLKRFAEAVAQLIILNPELAKDCVAKAPIPIDRGKGSPFWFAGTDTSAAYALSSLTLHSPSYEEAMKRARDLSPYDLAAELITSYRRIQGSRKPREALSLIAGEIVESGKLALLPKVRRVQAVPFIANLCVTPLFAVVKTFRRELWDGAGAGNPEYTQKLATRFKHALASDLSSYDETFSEELLYFIHEEVLPVIAAAAVRVGAMTRMEAEKALDADASILVMPILSPPASVDDGALILRREGTLRSGEKLTSEKGTFTNYYRAEAKLENLGTYGAIECLGDDLIVFTNREITPEAWSRKDLQWGFKEEVATSPNFLMRHVPGGFTYVARMCNGTLQKEAHLEPSTMEIMALGIKARQIQLKGITEPHPEAEVYDRFCEEMGGRVSEAHRIASGTDIVTLGRLASRSATTTYDVEEILDLIGSTTRDEEHEISAELPSSLSERRRMSYGELKTLGLKIRPNEARTIIRRRFEWHS